MTINLRLHCSLRGDVSDCLFIWVIPEILFNGLGLNLTKREHLRDPLMCLVVPSTRKEVVGVRDIPRDTGTWNTPTLLVGQEYSVCSYRS